jgi:hypothetical protein
MIQADNYPSGTSICIVVYNYATLCSRRHLMEIKLYMITMNKINRKSMDLIMIYYRCLQ